MTLDEAKAWLRGERSYCHCDPVVTAQVDAAMTQQAYWIVKAHSEGLMCNPWLEALRCGDAR